MKQRYDQLSLDISKLTTKTYSTSFSIGILALHPSIRQDIYAIYGFVRLADEIVDSFHDYDKSNLLEEFINDTWKSIHAGISLNPILNAFQQVVNNYSIDHELITQFLESMQMDLNDISYDERLLKQYILGSAEVVGLMCLQVFTHGDKEQYAQLKPYAMKLGSAFQKVNFLRDLKDDYKLLGRTYFPDVNMDAFTDEIKTSLEADIRKEFEEALIGIKMLPLKSRFGVYLAYKYYLSLFKKICSSKASTILEQRVRIPNSKKVALAMTSFLQYKFTL